MTVLHLALNDPDKKNIASLKTRELCLVCYKEKDEWRLDCAYRSTVSKEFKLLSRPASIRIADVCGFMSLEKWKMKGDL